MVSITTCPRTRPRRWNEDFGDREQAVELQGPREPSMQLAPSTNPAECLKNI